MGALTSKDGELKSHLDKIDEFEAHLVKTSLNHILIKNHDIAANKAKVKEQIPLEHIVDFAKLLKTLPNI